MSISYSYIRNMDMMLKSTQYCGKSRAMLLLNENFMARYKIPHVKNKEIFIPTSLLSKWCTFSPENLKYFCGSDLEEFLCCAALSGKKRKPNQSQ